MESRRYAAPVPCPAIASDLLWSLEAGQRLEAARALSDRARRRIQKGVDRWPPFSPGAANAWLLFVTTKPPWWKDPLLAWRELPLTLGEPHEGFFYPDPLGFWSEVRRWATELLEGHSTGWSTPEALSLTTLVHLADEPERLARALRQCRPRVIVFLDEPAWRAGQLDVVPHLHHIPDPHRAGVVYAGFWATTTDGVVVGKAPQHPATHRLYRTEDMAEYLRSAPLPGSKGSTD